MFHIVVNAKFNYCNIWEMHHHRVKGGGIWESWIEAGYNYIVTFAPDCSVIWGHLVHLQNFEIQTFQNATPSIFCYGASANNILSSAGDGSRKGWFGILRMFVFLT